MIVFYNMHTATCMYITLNSLAVHVYVAVKCHPAQWNSNPDCLYNYC